MTRDRVTVYLLSPQPHRRKPYFSLEWVDPLTKKRRSRSTKVSDLTAADVLRADLEYELNNGLYDSSGQIPWEDFEALYLAERMVHLRPRTLEAARGAFRMLRARCAPRTLADCTGDTISRFAGQLKQEGYAADTVSKQLAFLRAALRWAHKRGMIQRLPFIQFPKLPRRRTIKSITEAQFQSLLAACPSDEVRVALWTVWHSGLRRNETASLTWQESRTVLWLDLARERIVIPARACKADEDSWLPIHQELLPLLRGIERPTGRVFPAIRSGAQLGHLFGRIAALAGVDCTLHDLRRSFGCRYAQVASAHILQRLMRHSDISITMQFYVDIDCSLAATLNRLGKENSPSTTPGTISPKPAIPGDL